MNEAVIDNTKIEGEALAEGCGCIPQKVSNGKWFASLLQTAGVLVLLLIPKLEIVIV